MVGRTFNVQIEKLVAGKLGFDISPQIPYTEPVRPLETE
jgi:hypothetical protein